MPSVKTPSAPTDRYILISADCHAGANHGPTGRTSSERYLDDFDAWRAQYANPFRDLQGDGRSRNWDDERRIRDRRRTAAWSPRSSSRTRSRRSSRPPCTSRRPPMPDEYEHRLAGIRAHNRWLVDFCAAYPERRAGIGQIFLNDLDDAIADMHWIKEHGLRGGILLPSVPPDVTHIIDPLYSSSYDKLWAVCQDLDVVVNQHSGTGAPDYGPEPAGGVIWLTETAFFSQRSSCTHILAGRFDRFPGLRFVLTEQGCSWIPKTLGQLDFFHAMMKKTGRVGELKFTPEQVTPMKPSEYFRPQLPGRCELPSPAEAAAREVHRDGQLHVGQRLPAQREHVPVHA